MIDAFGSFLQKAREADEQGAAGILLSLTGPDIPPDLVNGPDAATVRLRVPIGHVTKAVADTLRLSLGIAELEDPTEVRRKVVAQELADVLW